MPCMGTECLQMHTATMKHVLHATCAFSHTSDCMQGAPLTGSGRGRGCCAWAEGLEMAPASAANSSKAGTPPGNPCGGAGQAEAPLFPNMLPCSGHDGQLFSSGSFSRFRCLAGDQLLPNCCLQRTAPAACDPQHLHTIIVRQEPRSPQPVLCMARCCRCSMPMQRCFCAACIPLSRHLPELVPGQSFPCPSGSYPARHKPSSLGAWSTIKLAFHVRVKQEHRRCQRRHPSRSQLVNGN